MKSFFSENRQKRTIGHSNCVLLYILGYLLDLSDFSSFDTFPTSRSPSETKEIDLKVFLILLFTWVWWVEHFGITSRLCLAIRSKSWLTRKEGGKHTTPPLGMVINSRHMGQRNCPVSRAKVATIRSRQSRQTVCEHGNNLGLCSTPSYIPVGQRVIIKRKYYRAESGTEVVKNWEEQEETSYWDIT